MTVKVQKDEWNILQELASIAEEESDLMTERASLRVSALSHDLKAIRSQRVEEDGAT